MSSLCSTSTGLRMTLKVVSIQLMEHSNLFDQHSYLRFPLEMHVVYFKAKYVYFEEAAKHDDGIVFEVHFFYIQPDDNAPLNKIIGGLGSICKPGTSAKVDLMSLDSILLAFTSDYLLYAGRITAQKGGHKVIWLISRRPSGVSHRQMIGFRTLCGKDGRSLLRNFHYLYELGSRRIYHVNMSDYLIGSILPYPRQFSNENNKLRIQFCNIPTLEAKKTQMSGIKSNEPSENIYTPPTHFQKNIHFKPKKRNSKIMSSLSSSTISIVDYEASKPRLREPQFMSFDSSFESVSSLYGTDSGATEVLMKMPDKKEINAANLNIDNIREVISVLMEEQTKKIIEELKTNQTTSQSNDVSSTNKVSISKIVSSEDNKGKFRTKKKEKNEIQELLINQQTLEQNSKKKIAKEGEFQDKRATSIKTSLINDTINPHLEIHVNKKNVSRGIKNIIRLSSEISFESTSNQNNTSWQQLKKRVEKNPKRKSNSPLINFNSVPLNISSTQTSTISNHKLQNKSRREIGNLKIYDEKGSKKYKIIKNESSRGISLKEKHCDSSSSTILSKKNSRKVKKQNLKGNSDIEFKKTGLHKNNSQVKSTTSKGSFYFVVKKNPEKVNRAKNEGFFSTFLLVAKEMLTSRLSKVNQSLSKISSDCGKKKDDKHSRKCENGSSSKSERIKPNNKNKMKRQSLSSIHRSGNIKKKTSKRNKQIGLESG